MRLIDADALLDEAMDRYCKECDKRKGIKKGEYRIIYNIGEAPCRACEIDDMKAELEDAPTIDAVPVKHGKWVTDTDGILHCSNCTSIPINRILFRGSLIYEVDIKTFMKFCPKCGARME